MGGMRKIAALVLLFLPVALRAIDDPVTVYTEDRYFITSGELDFPVDSSDLSITLLKYNEYNRWALRGMQGVDKESEGLIVYFTDVDYDSRQGLFQVIFDVNVIWPIGRKGSVIMMRPVQKYNNRGELESITLIPLIGTKMVEDALLTFELRRTPGGSSIAYESKIRLTKFFDFFFTLKSYKKNFEWYVLKVAGNFSDYVNGH